MTRSVKINSDSVQLDNIKVKPNYLAVDYSGYWHGKLFDFYAEIGEVLVKS